MNEQSGITHLYNELSTYLKGGGACISSTLDGSISVSHHNWELKITPDIGLFYVSCCTLWLRISNAALVVKFVKLMMGHGAFLFDDKEDDAPSEYQYCVNKLPGILFSKIDALASIHDFTRNKLDEPYYEINIMHKSLPGAKIYVKYESVAMVVGDTVVYKDGRIVHALKRIKYLAKLFVKDGNYQQKLNRLSYVKRGSFMSSKNLRLSSSALVARPELKSSVNASTLHVSSLGSTVVTDSDETHYNKLRLKRFYVSSKKILGIKENWPVEYTLCGDVITFKTSNVEINISYDKNSYILENVKMGEVQRFSYSDAVCILYDFCKGYWRTLEAMPPESPKEAPNPCPPQPAVELSTFCEEEKSAGNEKSISPTLDTNDIKLPTSEVVGDVTEEETFPISTSEESSGSDTRTSKQSNSPHSSVEANIGPQEEPERYVPIAIPSSSYVEIQQKVAERDEISAPYRIYNENTDQEDDWMGEWKARVIEESKNLVSQLSYQLSILSKSPDAPEYIAHKLVGGLLDIFWDKIHQWYSDFLATKGDKDMLQYLWELNKAMFLDEIVYDIQNDEQFFQLLSEYNLDGESVILDTNVREILTLLLGMVIETDGVAPGTPLNININLY